MSFVPLGPKPQRVLAREKRRKKEAGLLEESDPKAAAAVMAGMAVAQVNGDPKFSQLREACAAAGMKMAVVNSLIKRLQVGNYSPVSAEVKRLATKDLLEELGKKTALVLEYMDEYTVSTASLKDLSIAASILIEKEQLLKGLPTQNIDFTSRQELRVVMPALLAEAKRRGITVDVTATRIQEAT